MISLEQLDNSTKGVKISGNGQRTCFCPSHDDSHRSCSYKMSDDENHIMVNCFAGCSRRDIIEAWGFKVEDCKNGNDANNLGGWSVVADYPYIDEAGEEVYRVTRFSDGKDNKIFRPRWDLGYGDYQWGFGPHPRILYRLPELIEAIGEGRDIFIVEGEKDVHTLVDMGLCATTNPLGANSWKSEYFKSQLLGASRVFVIPDNDDAGDKWSQIVAKTANEVADEVHIVCIQSQFKGYDVSDLVNDGATKEDILKLCEKAERFSPKAMRSKKNREDSNAEILVTEYLIDLYGDWMRFCVDKQVWFVFRKVKWVEDEGLVLMRYLVKQTLEAMQEEANEKRGTQDEQRLREAVKSCGTDKKMRAVCNNAQTKLSSHVRSEDFYKQPYLMNFKNGTLDLRTLALHPHDKDDLISQVCPHNYDPNAQCPEWDKFMHFLTSGDEGLKRCLQQLVGYCLTGDTMERIFLVLHGDGTNGKSTFLNALQYVMGEDYAVNIEPSALMLNHFGETTNYELANIRGKRLVSTIEVDDGKRFSESTVKLFSGGGDKVSVRQIRQKHEKFVPECKIWMGTNHKPLITGTDRGIWSRLKLIPTTNSIPEEEIDLDLPNRLNNEAEGIIAWAVRGYEDYHKNGGFAIPEVVRSAIEEYRSKEDKFGQFLAEETENVADAVTLLSEIYLTYKSSAEKRGETPIGMNKVSDELKSRGYTLERPNSGPYRKKTICKGLCLMNPVIDDKDRHDMIREGIRERKANMGNSSSIL